MDFQAKNKAPLCNGPDRLLLPFGQFTFRELSAKRTEGLFFVPFCFYNPSVTATPRHLPLHKGGFF